MLFSVIGALCAISTPAHAFLVDKIAAIVNSDVILFSEVEKFEKTLELRKQLDPILGISDELEKSGPARQKDLEFLVKEHLITQNFKITDSEVEQEIQTVQRTNNLDREQLVEFLKNKGYTFDQYFELMRIGLAKRNLLDREIRSRVNISEDDVRNYYYNNLAKSANIPLQYQLQVIFIDFKTYKSPKAAQETAEGALRSIKEGESFAEIAKRLSDAPSAGQGGELPGYTSGSELSEPLKSVVRQLQIGTVSDPLKSSDGYWIVKVLGKRSAESDDLKAKENQIRESLAKEEYKKQFEIWTERARSDAYVHSNL